MTTKIPVLVVPDTITFSQNLHNLKQVLTLYNPFKIGLRYKVLATNPPSYEVKPAQGFLEPSSSVDIIIRLKSKEKHPNDRFKLELYDDSATVQGKQIIAVRFNDTPPALPPSYADAVASHLPPHDAKNPRRNLAGGGRHGLNNGPNNSNNNQPVADRGMFSRLSSLMPLVIGALLIAALTSIDRSLLDYQTALWLAWAIGLATMFVQLTQFFRGPSGT